MKTARKKGHGHRGHDDRVPVVEGLLRGLYPFPRLPGNGVGRFDEAVRRILVRDFECVQLALQRGVLLIEREQPVFRKGHRRDRRRKLGRAAGKGRYGPGGLDHPFEPGSDFALEPQGIGAVVVHGQQEHGGEHVRTGVPPVREGRIGQRHTRCDEFALDAGQVLVQLADALHDARGVPQVVDAPGDGPVRRQQNAVQFLDVVADFFLEAFTHRECVKALEHVLRETAGLDFLHDPEMHEPVGAQEAVVEDALHPFAFLGDVGGRRHVGQGDVHGVVGFRGQRLEQLEQGEEEGAQHETEQPEEQGDAGGDAFVGELHGRFQRASSSGERTPKG